jgi:hypothetical protein
MISRFATSAPIFPGPGLRTAADRFCYTARHYDFLLRRGD